jgi:predicted transport protein
MVNLRKSATKMNQEMGEWGCKDITITLNAKSKLPDVQVPQLRRAIPN